MKVALILPGNLWLSPYAKIYTDILDEKGIFYEIISWNRDGKDPLYKNGFNLKNDSTFRFNKLLPYLMYLKFIKKIINENNYNKLIVFGPQLGIFLYPFLLNKYKKKFIFDFRDLSIEQLPFFKFIFKKMLSISYLNVISSEGFLKYLPKNDFIISHNFSDICKKKYSSENIFKDEKINILTIGSIRNYNSNLEVIKSLSNKENVNLYFVGNGIVSDMLKKFAEENKIENIFFHGFYEKNEEEKFINGANFLNIYMPKIKSHDSLMSNRFYNALIYKRPMIVTNKSIQGDYVEEYKLGLSLDNCNNLYEEIINYKKEFDFSTFDNSSNDLLTVFKNDYHVFYDRVKNFLEN